MYRRAHSCSTANPTVYRIDLYANRGTASGIMEYLKDAFGERWRSARSAIYADTPITSVYLTVAGWSPVADLRLMGGAVWKTIGPAMSMFPGVQHVHIDVDHPAASLRDRLNSMALLDGTDGELIKWLLERGGDGKVVCHKGYPFYRKKEEKVSAPYLLPRPKWLKTTLLENYSYLEAKAISSRIPFERAKAFTKTFVNLAYETE